MFLKIMNSGSLPRECLEMVGLSSKRNRRQDSSVIGQFGSGTKFAAAAALRACIHTGISSTDARGRYYLTFDTEEIRPEGYETHRRIVYRYFADDGSVVSDAYVYPTDRVVEAFPDWDKPIGADTMRLFKILREHLCNAVDEDKEFTWEFTDSHVMVDPGKTCVYLSEHAEFRGMLEQHPERYFKFLSKRAPIYSAPGIGKIWFKSDERTNRLFLLGVMVSCSDKEDETSIFDYSLFKKHLLSEERILKDQYQYLNGLADMFAKLEDRLLMRMILRAIDKGVAPFETKVLGRITSSKLTDVSKKAWLEVVREMYGEKLALPCGNPRIDEDVRQVLGYPVPTEIADELKQFFRCIGIPTSAEVMPKASDKDYRRVSLDQLALPERSKFLRAYKLFSENSPDLVRFPVVLYVPLTEEMRKLAGFAGDAAHRFQQIWVAVKDDLTLPPEHELYITLEHEGRHCGTGAQDQDRAFMDQADRDLAQRAYRAAGHAKFPGTDLIVRRLAPPRPPKFAEATGEEDGCIDITEEVEALRLADEKKQR